jgi:LmbE family N-acetylglucosaminyl deacetylase
MRVDDNTKCTKWQLERPLQRCAPLFLRYNGGMRWIYLSPHFDDVALSCGGLVWEQVQAGSAVIIWTVCAGSAPVGKLSPFAKELHIRWKVNEDATTQRRIEDLNSCRRMGATWQHFNLPDCIYRQDPRSGEYMYSSEASLNGTLHPADTFTSVSLQQEIKSFQSSDTVLVSPLGLGNHVDHQLTRQVAEGQGYSTWYYADYPYVLRCKEKLDEMQQEGWVSQVFPISPDGLVAWQDSIAAHGSQISTFWKGEPEMRLAVLEYLDENKGIRLWKKPVP